MSGAIFCLLTMVACFWHNESLLNGETAKVFSLSQLSLSRTIIQDQFTLIMSVHGILSNATHTLLKYYCRNHNLHRLILSWNEPRLGIVEQLATALQRRCNVPVFVALHAKNLLTNRFSFRQTFVCTLYVLHLDDDIFISNNIVSSAFAFARSSSVGLLGFFCASFSRLSDAPLRVTYVSHSKLLHDPVCNLLLTGMAFVDCRYHDLFFLHRYQGLRLVVDELLSGEDLLMNFVVASHSNNSVQAAYFDWTSIQNGNIDIHFGHSERSSFLWLRDHPIVDGERRHRRAFILETILESALLQTPDYVRKVKGSGGLSNVTFLAIEQQAFRARNVSDFNFFVLIPFGETAVADALERSVASALWQDDVHKVLWLFVDGRNSSASTKRFVNRVCGGDVSRDLYPLFVNVYDTETLNLRAVLACVVSQRRRGPGFSKYHGFRTILQFSRQDDVVIVLDGDDEFARPDALSILRNDYNARGCWCSYGSMSGLYAEQQGPLELPATPTEPFLPRQMRWRFSHPRSFKITLFKFMNVTDFQDHRGNWLMKCSERGYVYRMLELAGASRVCFQRTVIYKYFTGPKGPQTVNDVSFHERKALIVRFQNMKSSTPLNESCCF